MTAIFNRRILTRTYFIVLVVLVVLAVLANYFNYTVTNAFCTDGAGISCILTNNYQLIRFLSFAMIIIVLLYTLYLAWVYDANVIEKDEVVELEEINVHEEITEIDVQGVVPGYYLEVEADSTSTGRVIEHTSGDLPEVIKEGNYWVPMTEDYVEDEYATYTLYKPGQSVTKGYYLEIDAEYNTTGRYIYQERKLPPTRTKGNWWILVVDKEDSTETVESIAVTEREVVSTAMAAEAGDYLEVDSDKTPTGRTITHEGGKLPKVLKEGNYWVALEKEETEEYTTVDYSQHELYKPSNRVTPGYYLELDENLESVGRYIYQERKLPPTGKKGHSWVKVVDKGESVDVQPFSVKDREEVSTAIEAEAGDYLEVDSDKTPTGRTITHQGGKLPKVLKEGNYWIALEKEETEEFTTVDYSQHELYKPSHRVTPGYYLELDENLESVERYIYQERKLPPTRKKGHSWVQVVDKGESTETMEVIDTPNQNEDQTTPVA